MNSIIKFLHVTFNIPFEENLNHHKQKHNSDELEEKDLLGIISKVCLYK